MNFGILLTAIGATFLTLAFVAISTDAERSTIVGLTAVGAICWPLGLGVLAA